MQEPSDPIQTASVDFFLAIASAYVAVCITWWAFRKLAESRWHDEPFVETDRPWLDFAMIFVAVASAFGLGAAYRYDLLIPGFSEPWSGLSTAINLCIPFAPIFVVLILRRQSLQTVWISGQSWQWKIAAGMLASLVGLVVFLGLRNEFYRMSDVLVEAVRFHSWIHAPAVFLEAVAVAFIFVRLRWVARPGIALLIPCLLFAAAHIPSGIASGRTPMDIVAFFLFNTMISAIIFFTVMKARDVIWIAIPHFVLDIAIGAFE